MSGFFSFPTNYRAGTQNFLSNASWARMGAGVESASEVSDGRNDTYKDGEYFVIDLPGTATTRFTHLFLRSSGVTHVSVNNPAGTGGITRTVASRYVWWTFLNHQWNPSQPFSNGSNCQRASIPF